MTLSIKDDSGVIRIQDNDETIVSIHMDDHGIVVSANQKLIDGSTGESIRRKSPVEYISYTRRKLQHEEKFYQAIQQTVEKYVRENSDTTLHSVWSSSREAINMLQNNDDQIISDTL